MQIEGHYWSGGLCYSWGVVPYKTREIMHFNIILLLLSGMYVTTIL